MGLKKIFGSLCKKKEQPAGKPAEKPAEAPKK
jgi:hypothetical protein